MKPATPYGAHDTTMEALAEWSAEMTLLSLEVAARHHQWAYHQFDDGNRLYAILDGDAVRFQRSFEGLFVRFTRSFEGLFPPKTTLAMGDTPLSREQAGELLREHKARLAVT